MNPADVPAEDTATPAAAKHGGWVEWSAEPT